jgi:hypothetical protein
MKKILLGTVFAASLLAAVPAQAYYDTRDNPEYIMIQANQSAFAIPVVGDNKSTQTNFGSKSFLDANKVATKRFMVPHTRINNPNWGTSDYYVPTVLLILVDRTPYMREWRDENDRGTSNKKEGFQFQSREGINIGTGVSIAAMVKEEDAATFLYWWGTKNAVYTDTASQFASTAQGKSLAEIMDTVVRGMVQSELSSAFMKRSFVEGNAQAADIMAEVRDRVTKHFADKGITIDYIGYSGPLNYSDSIQKSIDSVFISQQSAASSAAMMAAVPYMREQAQINVVNAQAEAIKKWNGAIPALPGSVTTVGQGWIDTLLGYVGWGPKPGDKR